MITFPKSGETFFAFRNCFFSPVGLPGSGFLGSALGTNEVWALIDSLRGELRPGDLIIDTTTGIRLKWGRNPMNHNLRWTNFVVVLSYRGLMAAIGMLLSRLQSTMENFFVAKRAIPACTHLGNIVVRTGRKVKYESKAKSIPGDTEANQFPGWQYRNHWFAPKL